MAGGTSPLGLAKRSKPVVKGPMDGHTIRRAGRNRTPSRTSKQEKMGAANIGTL